MPVRPPKGAWTSSQTTKSLSQSELIAKAFGKECALAYEYFMMADRQNGDEISFRPEKVLKVILKKTNCSVIKYELPHDFDLFKKKLKNSLVNYFKALDGDLMDFISQHLAENQLLFSGLKCKLDHFQN